jgi:hypothetical protein
MRQHRFSLIQWSAATLLMLLLATASTARAQADTLFAAAKHLQGLIDRLAETGSINEDQLGLAWRALHEAEGRLPPQMKASVSGPGPAKGYIACGVKLANAHLWARQRLMQRAHQEAQAAIQCYEHVLGSSTQPLPPSTACTTVECRCTQILKPLDTGSMPPVAPGGRGWPVLGQAWAASSDIRLAQAGPVIPIEPPLPPGIVGLLIKVFILSRVELPSVFDTVIKEPFCDELILDNVQTVLNWWNAQYNASIDQMQRISHRRGFRKDDPEYTKWVDYNLLLSKGIKRFRKAYDEARARNPLEGRPPSTVLSFPQWAL